MRDLKKPAQPSNHGLRPMTVVALFFGVLGVVLFFLGAKSPATALLLVAPVLPLLDTVLRGSVTSARLRRHIPVNSSVPQRDFYLSSFRRGL